MRVQLQQFISVGTLVIAFVITTSPAHAGYVDLAWEAPVANTDGSPLTDLAGYYLYYWQDDWDIPGHIDVGHRTRYKLTRLTRWETYSFAITAYNATGEESGFSNTLRLTARSGSHTSIPTPDAAPPAVSPGEYDWVVSDATPGNTEQESPPSAAMITTIRVKELPLEVGEILVDHTWSRVTLQKSFQDPIVVAKPLSHRDSDPAVIRIRYVAPRSFDIRLQEWDDENGVHSLETVSYLVMERGSYDLPDGTQIAADRFPTNQTSRFDRVAFQRPFQNLPVVLAAVESFNESEAVTTRIRAIDPEGFALRLQEQERNAQVHDPEMIAYIAWEPSAGTLEGVSFEVQTTTNEVTDKFSTIWFTQPFLSPPMFLADMQTTHGGNTATLRWDNRDEYGIDIRIAEEQSRDSETAHIPEVVGYILMARYDSDLDSDGDGLTDQEEILTYGTDPAVADTDSDGIADGVEISRGFDPVDPNSKP